MGHTKLGLGQIKLCLGASTKLGLRAQWEELRGEPIRNWAYWAR